MATKVTAGERLRRRMNAALKAASTAEEVPLVWDEHEREALAAAVAAEDRREVIAAHFDAAAARDDSDPALLAKLSAECRALEGAIARALDRLSFGAGPVKSKPHQRAANARWDRHRERQQLREVRGG